MKWEFLSEVNFGQADQACTHSIEYLHIFSTYQNFQEEIPTYFL